MTDPLSAIRHWLSPAQILLLRASLLQGDDAVKAWRAWRSMVDLDNLDPDSNRLLPLAWKNLTGLGESDPWFGRLKGVHHYHWARNQLVLAESIEGVRVLQQADISVMLLKGSAMIIHYYRDPGVRPAVDFDLMVPFDKVEAAGEALGCNGWKLNEPGHQSVNSVSRTGHAAFFVNGRHAMLDLHWHLFLDDRRVGADAEHWQYARTIETHGVSVKIPSPTDLLFHICAHGAWGPASPIRWVADGVTLLRQAEGDIDWSRLIAQARSRRLSLPLLSTLSFLREEFGENVPIETTRALGQGPHTWLERMELRQRTRPFRLLGALPFHCSTYLRTTRNLNSWQKLTGIPAHFRHVWNLNRSHQIPGYVARRALERVWMKLKRRAA